MALIQCPVCGATISDLATTCPKCGAALPKKEAPTGEQAAPQAPPQQAAPQQPVYPTTNPQQPVYPTTNPQQQAYPTTNPDDVPNGGLNFVAFLIPLAGLILYLVYKDKTPVKAKEIGKWALIGLAVDVAWGIFRALIW